MIGNDLQKLMSYQGDNQFTKVVKALKFIQDQFDRVMKNMDKVECGVTKIAIGNLIASALSPKENAHSNSIRKKRNTIIDTLGAKLDVQIQSNAANKHRHKFPQIRYGTMGSKHSDSPLDKIRDKMEMVKKASSKHSPHFVENKRKPTFTDHHDNMIKLAGSKAKVSPEVPRKFFGADVSKNLPHNTTNSANNAGTLNLNTTGPFESPAISKIKKRINKNNESVGVSDINNESHENEESMADSSLLKDLLKDDPNVVFSKDEVSHNQFSKFNFFRMEY